MATVLITGCSKGIGFESALAFARAGYTVLATMRDPANLRRGPIDVLVNNAGVEAVGCIEDQPPLDRGVARGAPSHPVHYTGYRAHLPRPARREASTRNLTERAS